MPIESKPAFLDTAYVFALVSTRDHWHPVATDWQKKLADERRPLVTTGFVLTEIADGLAAVHFRDHAVRATDLLRSSSLVETVPVSSELFNKALDLYQSRSDKECGLTDCAPFVVMEEQGLFDALTTDQHFRQAGFREGVS